MEQEAITTQLGRIAAGIVGLIVGIPALLCLAILGMNWAISHPDSKLVPWAIFLPWAAFVGLVLLGGAFVIALVVFTVSRLLRDQPPTA